MIIVRLIGGLGNQMFQYSLGKNLALINNTELKLDITELDIDKPNSNCTKRTFELRNFKICNDIASIDEINYNKNNLGIKYKISKLLNLYYTQKYIQEISLEFDENILNTKNNTYLDGYWQCEKYFFNIKKKLLSDFIPNKPLCNKVCEYEQKIIKRNSVSLHIRRGDYISRYSDYYYIHNIDYYIKALTIIKSIHSNINVFVFSDDIPWAKENLHLEDETFFVKNNEGYEDILLMSKCKHNIIANSSFSWWGAWLNSNPNKMCIAPLNWFKNVNIKHNIIPNDWITI